MQVKAISAWQEANLPLLSKASKPLVSCRQFVLWQFEKGEVLFSAKYTKMLYTGDSSDPIPFSEVLWPVSLTVAGPLVCHTCTSACPLRPLPAAAFLLLWQHPARHSILGGTQQKLGLLCLFFLTVLRGERVTATAAWWPLLLWSLYWDKSRVTCTERHSAGRKKCISVTGSSWHSQFLEAAHVYHRLCIMSKCQSPFWLLAEEDFSPKMYHENKSEADGPKSTPTSVFCEIGNGGSLGHGDRFCTLKKSAGREAAGAGAELHRWDGVALMKGVRAAAPPVGSGERPQCSSCVLFGQKTYLMQKASILGLVRKGTTRLVW